MTLRGRLTAAFLAVVLGPVLLGALFVGGTMAAVGHQQSQERLTLAANTIRTSVAALCQQLRAAAESVALSGEPAGRVDAATQVVTRGMAGAVLVTGAGGATVFQTPGAPPRPWTDCADGTADRAPVTALAVQVRLRDPSGAEAGTVAAAQLLDLSFVSRLAAVSGVAVTLLGDGWRAEAARSTERDPRALVAALAAARTVSGGQIAQTPGGRYVRRVGPSPGQPLPLVLSAPYDPPRALYALLAGAVVVAGFLAVVAAWRLARSTTRPLAELARAVDRVAEGDLTARVPVRARDEVGRLARTFNRMTRETQSYVQALTASRDQLRSHLAVLGDTLASTHDLQRILRVILESALTATGARAGVVLLVDQSTGMLVGGCAASLDGRWPAPSTVPTAGDGSPDTPVLRVPLGVGLLGRVAATGEPLRGRVDRDGPPLAPEEPRCRTYVAVPFAASGPDDEVPVPANRSNGPAGSAPVPAALGVLALYDRLGSDEFDDTDLVTLRTFARHAAVAVDNVRVHEEAQRLSLTDPLTGLWNYRYLKESIRREVERASRFGRMLSVLVLDLDRFKEVNDTYGHAAGDAVLAEFARRIRGALREVDLAFRQGGEEFVVLLPETDARGAAIVAERLGAAIRETAITLGPAAGQAGPRPVVRVTVSIGIAVYPDHATTGQRVLDAADDALYVAKAAGRDTYRMAVPAERPPAREMTVPAGAVPPDDGLPRAGGRPTTTANGRTSGEGNGRGGAPPGGASSGPHPPRQSRGR